MFEEIEFLDEHEPTDDALRQAMEGVDASLADEECQALIGRFREVLRVSEVRHALSRQGATRLWRERPFAVFDDQGRLVTGRFDRVAITDAESGGDPRPVSAVVIDYKTDRCSEEELGDRVAHHRPQMQAYRRAAAARLSLALEDVSAKLVFTRLGRVTTVS
jgi:ATP-dependent exoDNAse (exonuclease V) beta subunit